MPIETLRDVQRRCVRNVRDSSAVPEPIVSRAEALRFLRMLLSPG